MKQAVPYLGRFVSKFVFEIIPGALVSVLAAYFLSVLHIARGAEPAAEPPSVAAMQSDGLSADQRRELTRQMLKERRENPEEPAEVKPIPSLRPTAPPPETADIAPQIVAPPVAAPQIAAPQIAAPESKPRSEPEAKPRPEIARPAVATVTPAPTPLPRAPAPRIRTEPAPVAAAPPAASVTAALPPGAAPPPSGATPLPPVTVTTTPPDAPAEPPRRGIVGTVFSGISTIAGGAANVTGNTVNWVIDLPGKAISAGGRLLGGGSTPAAAPAPTAAPPAAPAPTAVPAPAVDPQRRNYL
jgi:outer membrane biosynthesis protein TonB